ncbi:MAG: elongation factor Ts [Alphaproteobacteria bacterium]|nr:MAG: elongation factor Ts [Alphaproteobacteria bacterium]
MKVSASDIKKLRDETQAGMLDCKKALTESNGDYKAAVEYLRKKGLSAVASRSGRIAAEGAIVIDVDVTGTKGAMIEVNSETDFVARNENFQDVTGKIAEIMAKEQTSFEDTLKLRYDDAHTVEGAITDLAARIKENIFIRRGQTLSIDQGVITSYLHNSLGPKHGKIGVLVALKSASDKRNALHEIGKKIAMHIAAIKPKSLDISDLPQDLIDAERDIYAAQAKASGKPEQFIEKMVEGRLRKFYEEVVLLEQSFALEPKLKVKEFVEQEAKALGVEIVLADFAFYMLGEGVEKEEKDFAKEVQEQMNRK